MVVYGCIMYFVLAVATVLDTGLVVLTKTSQKRTEQSPASQKSVATTPIFTL